MPTKQKKSNNADNPKKGMLFENEAKEYFKNKLNLSLERGLSLKISANGKEKGEHKFDLGSKQEKIIIECKSHKWTAGYNAPSAKMSVWNEAMYYFHLAPKDYRKIFFVLKDENKKKKDKNGQSQTLANYYISRYRHLIPKGVEIWEYDQEKEDIKIYSF